MYSNSNKGIGRCIDELISVLKDLNDSSRLIVIKAVCEHLDIQVSPNLKNNHTTPQIEKPKKRQLFNDEKIKYSRKIKISKDTYDIRYSYEILIKTAEWLIKKKDLKISDCPIKFGRSRRYLVNNIPKHKHRKFINPKELSNGLYVEACRNKENIIKNSKRLLEKYGYIGDILEVY